MTLPLLMWYIQIHTPVEAALAESGVCSANQAHMIKACFTRSLHMFREIQFLSQGHI